MADITVAPGGTYEISIDWGSTGATLGVRVLDNAGATTIARATGFTEYPASSGVYYKTSNTAPSLAGQYTLLIDDDAGTAATGHTATIDLVVTGAGSISVGAGNLYVTRDQLKVTRNIGSTYADDDIDVAVSAASRACDGYKNDRFYPTTETRDYTPDRCSNRLTIDSLNTLTSVTVDTAADGTYATTWTEGTEFFLAPRNADADGVPYTEIVLRAQSGAAWPAYENSIRVIGSFGWATVPANVAQAASILASRLLRRARETPEGILVVAGEAVAAARLGRVDPDVAFLLDNIRGKHPLLAL